MELRIIFRVIPSHQGTTVEGDRFLTYGQRFDIVPQINAKLSGSNIKGCFPDPISSLYVLTRARRANGMIMGDILPLDQVRTLVDLIPKFGKTADRRLSKENSISCSSQYWLNKYFDKELFWPLTLNV